MAYAMSKNKKKLGSRVALTITSLLLVLGMTAGCGITSSDTSSAEPRASDAASQSAKMDENSSSAKHTSVDTAATRTSTSNKIALSVADIYKKNSISIVSIGTEYTATNFFGQSVPQASSGSGIITSSDGYILTCNHVIDGATDIIVTLSDKSEYEATVIGQDPVGDLAIIKIDATGLTPAEFGDSDQLEVGELAVAIGNPLGEYANTCTTGIISGIERSIRIEDSIPTNLIQTDAAISPGNSGGALVNSYGEVIGVTSAKSSGSGIEGIGFAVPINEVKDVMDDLINKGYATGRPLIGISGSTVSKEYSENYNIPTGVYISEVTAGGAADEAGLEVGDVIVSFNGESIKSMEDLNTQKNKQKAGDRVELIVMRNSKEYTVQLTLGEQPQVSSSGTQNGQIPEELKEYFEDRGNNRGMR